MKIERRSPPTEIQVYSPGLDSIPGWHALNQKEQGELYERTMRANQYRQMRAFGEFGDIMELYATAKLLEGKEMKIKDYIRHIYSDRHQRTVERKVQAFNELAERIPPKVLTRLTTLGPEVLSQFDRIATAALGDIRNAVREMKILPASTDASPQHYLEELDTKLLEHRQNKRKGKKLHQDEQFAAKMATNAVISYIRACGLKSSAEKRKFLTRVMGWVMEAQAVSGTLRAGRIPIPDGILILRGRPRKYPKKEAA